MKTTEPQIDTAAVKRPFTAKSAIAAELHAPAVAPRPLRILAAADTRQGADCYAYVRAFRRLGHSVVVLPSAHYIPWTWRSNVLRIARRLAQPYLVRQYTKALIAAAEQLQPDLFFVFKGRFVTRQAVAAIGELGAATINLYPDVSVKTHGRYLPAALPHYDWIFTTKQFGAADMQRAVGAMQVSFIAPSYDPEVHFPAALSDSDKSLYACDASFIGSWSPKKERYLAELIERLPSLHLRVWGDQWGRAGGALRKSVERRTVWGVEYAKALRASKINIALLSEIRPGASSGDQITARTFQIPATGAFVLHERTDELAEYFEEGRECACFGSPAELAEQTAHYLARDTERATIGEAGRRRVIESGYAVDHRAEVVITRAIEMQALRKSPAR